MSKRSGLQVWGLFVVVSSRARDDGSSNIFPGGLFFCFPGKRDGLVRKRKVMREVGRSLPIGSDARRESCSGEARVGDGL